MCSLGFFKEQYVLYSARTTSNVPTKTIQTKNDRSIEDPNNKYTLFIINLKQVSYRVTRIF